MMGEQTQALARRRPWNAHGGDSVAGPMASRLPAQWGANVAMVEEG